MIQPYFDPTVSFQGGSIFSQYLQGFVKERSAMNRQIMEVALAQADPTFLQKQIQLMNENIIALEKAKAKALIGDAKAKQDLLKITSPFARISYQYEKDVGVVQTEMGGKALTSLSAKDAAVKVAMTEGTQEDREKAITKLLADESDPVARTALLIAIEEQVDATGAPSVDKSKLDGYSAPQMKRPVFLSQYGASTGIAPYTRRVDEMLDYVEGKSGAMTPANQAALNNQIDAAIKKYETQRAGYEKQLADLQEGGVDPFAGFSRNYMLDNPFIQMSRSQGKVDALASAIEATQQEDFRTMPTLPPAPEPDIITPYDSDDVFLSGGLNMPSDTGVIEETITINPEASFPSDPSEEGQFLQLDTRKVGPGFPTKTPTTTFAGLEKLNPKAASDFFRLTGYARSEGGKFRTKDQQLQKTLQERSILKKDYEAGLVRPMTDYELFLVKSSEEEVSAIVDDIYNMPNREFRKLDRKYKLYDQGKAEVLSQ